jgi:hypothetical protein
MSCSTVYILPEASIPPKAQSDFTTPTGKFAAKRRDQTVSSIFLAGIARRLRLPCFLVFTEARQHEIGDGWEILLNGSQLDLLDVRGIEPQLQCLFAGLGWGVVRCFCHTGILAGKHP